MFKTYMLCHKDVSVHGRFNREDIYYGLIPSTIRVKTRNALADSRNRSPCVGYNQTDYLTKQLINSVANASCYESLRSREDPLRFITIEYSPTIPAWCRDTLLDQWPKRSIIQY